MGVRAAAAPRPRGALYLNTLPHEYNAMLMLMPGSLVFYMTLFEHIGYEFLRQGMLFRSRHAMIAFIRVLEKERSGNLLETYENSFFREIPCVDMFGNRHMCSYNLRLDFE